MDDTPVQNYAHTLALRETKYTFVYSYSFAYVCYWGNPIVIKLHYFKGALCSFDKEVQTQQKINKAWS